MKRLQSGEHAGAQQDGRYVVEDFAPVLLDQVEDEQPLLFACLCHDVARSGTADDEPCCKDVEHSDRCHSDVCGSRNASLGICGLFAVERCGFEADEAEEGEH